MKLQIITINSDTLFITTPKGTWYVDMDKIKVVHAAAEQGVIYPSCFVAIEYHDGSKVIVGFPTLDEAKSCQDMVVKLWMSWHTHWGCYENSSEQPKTRRVDDNTLLVIWGSATVLIDRTTLLGLRTESKLVRIDLGPKGVVKLASSKPEYLSAVHDTIAGFMGGAKK